MKKIVESDLNFKLVKDLGIEWTSPKHLEKRRYILVECPTCLTNFRIRLTDAKGNRTKQCTSCANRASATTLQNLETGTKKCQHCKETKPLEAFSNNKNSKDGKGSRCRVCDGIARKKYYQENEKGREKAYRNARNRMLQSKYGITIEDFEIMLTKQGNKCGICGIHIDEAKANDGLKSGIDNRPREFSVDHCHATGKVRGLLCNECNRGIGMIGDTSDALYKAYKYLLQAKCH